MLADRVQQDGKRLTIKTSGLHDVLSIADKREEPNYMSVSHLDDADLSGKHAHYMEGWADTANWAQAKALALHGWEEGRKDMQATLDKVIASATHDDHSGYRWEVEGDFFDVGTMLSGEPEHWMQSTYEPKRRVWKVTLGVVTGHKMLASTIMNRGAAILGLIDALQDAGDIVELEAVHSVNKFTTAAGLRGKNLNTYVPLGTTPLDIGTTAFVMAHPSFQRRICTGVQEHVSPLKMNNGFGSPMDTQGERTDLRSGTIYLGPTDRAQFESEYGAKSWLEDMIRKINRL